MVGPGASGSWRWRTSKASSASARMVRSAHDGSGASGATEPLAAVGMVLPSGMTNSSGGGPSHGASTRASWPMRPQHPGQPEHLALHAARDGEAVRADEADAHRRDRTSGPPTARLTPARYLPGHARRRSSCAVPRRHRPASDRPSSTSRWRPSGGASPASPAQPRQRHGPVRRRWPTSRRHIPFWTSIQPIYLATPAETAGTASHLHEVSGGRFRLGLGVSHEPVTRASACEAGKPAGRHAGRTWPPSAPRPATADCRRSTSPRCGTRCSASPSRSPRAPSGPTRPAATCPPSSPGSRRGRRTASSGPT